MRGYIMIFRKSDDPDGWPFAHADAVQVVNLNGCLVVDEQYAMNGMANMILHLPDVPIIEGKSVGPYIRRVLG